MMNRRNFMWDAGATSAGFTALQQRITLARAGVVNESLAAEEMSKVPLLFGTDYYPVQTPEQ